MRCRVGLGVYFFFYFFKFFGEGFVGDYECCEVFFVEFFDEIIYIGVKYWFVREVYGCVFWILGFFEFFFWDVRVVFVIYEEFFLSFYVFFNYESWIILGLGKFGF